MDCDHMDHVKLPGIEGEFPRQECFVVLMKRPDAIAVSWMVNGTFISTDWCAVAGAELAKSLGAGTTHNAVLPKFIAEEYKKAGVVESMKSLGEMDFDELQEFSLGQRQ